MSKFNKNGKSRKDGNRNGGSRDKFYSKKYGSEKEIMDRFGKKKGRSKRVIEEVEGTLRMAAGGYGFVEIEGRTEDIFIPGAKMRNALNNDRVRVAITRKASENHSQEGEIIQIIERSKRPYIGVLQITGNRAWVIMEKKNMPYDIEVPIDQTKPENQGLKVAVLVTDWPRNKETPQGQLVDVLGKPGENNTEMHAILTEFGLPYKFSDEVEQAAAKIPVAIGPAELDGRKDFRKTCTFTIDPADAKDFDDACSLKKLENGHWEVGVHIADVSYYVKPKSVLDKEAVDRGTSVYLVDRTVPMLPEVLSNNLCSLRPGEPKLTFSAVFEMDDNAKIYSRWFGRTVIESDFRFAYEEVQQLIETNGDIAKYTPAICDSANINNPKAAADGNKIIRNNETGMSNAIPGKEIIDSVLELYKISTILRKKRFVNGSISFERPEMKVIVDEKGKPIDIIEKISKEANWLIEELMLLANKEVATYVTKGMKLKEPTFVYRIHDQPDMDKITELRTFVKHFGYKMDPADTPQQLAKALNKLLDSLKGKPECATIEILALRSMARAEYSTDNIGHYGLGFQYYTHFTSPIRRYPDMMVHRLLANYLSGGKNENKQLFQQLCQHSSEREQLATEAERASVKYKTTEFMQDKVGQIFDGVISSVTEWGLYVAIEPTKVEGMVALRDIKEDYFEFDEKMYCVTGRSTHKKFTLGDKVKVKLTGTNLEQKVIDFSLEWDPAWGEGSASAKTDSIKESYRDGSRSSHKNSSGSNSSRRNNSRRSSSGRNSKDRSKNSRDRSRNSRSGDNKSRRRRS